MGKYINKKHTFKLVSIGLLLAGLVSCGSNSGDNQAITLDELYKKHNLSEMTKMDEEMDHFNAVANYTLNAYSDTPYGKYVAEIIVEAANSQDPTAFEDIIYKLGDYYYNAGEFEAAQIEKTFFDYAPSFRKDNTDFKFERAILIANKEGIIDHAHSRYIVKFDKKYGTNIKDLDYFKQLKLEEVLKSNIGGENEQIINEIVAVAYIFFNDKKYSYIWEIGDALVECGNAKYHSGAKNRCKKGLNSLAVFSDTARKKAPYQFEGLIEPKEIIKLFEKEKNGTITKNESESFEKVFEYVVNLPLL